MRYSHTSLNLYRTCPHWFKRKYLDRDLPPEPESEAIRTGKSTHSEIEGHIYDSTQPVDPYAGALIKQVYKACRGYPRRFAEFPMGTDITLTEVRRPHKDDCAFMGIADFMVQPQYKDHWMFCADWKTGKRKPDFDQLDRLALLTFVNFPKVMGITSAFVWLKDRIIDKRVYERERDEPSLRLQLRTAIDRIESDRQFARKQNGLCKGWCPVLDCPLNGKYQP